MNDAAPNPAPSAGHRTLAAIVFTDVVGFSARMQRDEESTLKLLESDFQFMREACLRHNGAVLKTLGDGLLASFPSAVQAVAFALSIQRSFAEPNAARGEGTALVHRVGIHLGDVFMREGDVMGDGVNIASRLQAVAEPGGICISQTVYDVVKNKLALHAVRLGPRELKNIAEAIPVYQILLDAQSMVGAPDASAPVQRSSSPAGGDRRPHRGLWIAGACAAVALLVGGGVFVATRPGDAPSVPPSESPATSVATTEAPPAETAVNATGDTDAPGESLAEARARFLKTYDFDGLLAYLLEQRSGGGARGVAPQFMQGANRLVTMGEWMRNSIRGYSQESPLQLAGLAGNTSDLTSACVNGRREFVVESAAGSRTVELTALTPAELGAIILGLIKSAKRPPPDVAIDGAILFSHLYDLPEMTKALPAANSRRNRAP